MPQPTLQRGKKFEASVESKKGKKAQKTRKREIEIERKEKETKRVREKGVGSKKTQLYIRYKEGICVKERDKKVRKEGKWREKD